MKVSLCFLIFFLSLGGALSLEGLSERLLPVAYKGRFRPADVYARLWLYQIYHAQKFALPEATLIGSDSALEFLWQLEEKGSTAWRSLPLFWVGSSCIKQWLTLDTQLNRFSYDQLMQKIYNDATTSRPLFARLVRHLFWQSRPSGSPAVSLPLLLPGLTVQLQEDQLIVTSVEKSSPWPFLIEGEVISDNKSPLTPQEIKKDQASIDTLLQLLQHLRQFEALKGSVAAAEQAFQQAYYRLLATYPSSSLIASWLERHYPLKQRLKTVPSLFFALPSQDEKGEWLPLKALDVKVYQSELQMLLEAPNFTDYDEISFYHIKEAYTKWQQLIWDQSTRQQIKQARLQLIAELQTAYTQIVGKVYRQAHNKSLYYPSENQLWTESFYYRYPWHVVLLCLYSATALLLTFSRRSIYRVGAISLLFLPFCLHTILLLMRCYITQRPPVTNMLETVLYVPWITVLAGLFVSFKWPHVASIVAWSAALMLIVMEWADLNPSLDPVQAVLDSQFWLATHVLLVVGSYGLFLLGSALGHVYMAHFVYSKHASSELAYLILQTLYAGLALLITGTLLGGVWAAESWGRFWDWDPKESWAFISCCIYLLWIHAYRYHRIANFGLAFGAIFGFLAISFTWYGVNYILGSGLHSYGFGSGGQGYYWSFVIVEIIVLSYVLWHRNRIKIL